MRCRPSRRMVLDAILTHLDSLRQQHLDELLVLRRPDGSLFIGDVGIRKAPVQSQVQIPSHIRAPSDASMLLGDWARAKGIRVPRGFAFLPELRRRRGLRALGLVQPADGAGRLRRRRAPPGCAAHEEHAQR